MDRTSDHKSSATTTLGRLWITLVVVLISFLSFSVQFYAAFYRFRDIVLLNVFSFIIFFNYYLCTTTDPGGVPVHYEPDSLRDGMLDMHSNSNNARYCRSCAVYKPPRAHHCSRSGRCVLRMDHYCPWMNNCIGYYNYAHFIRFLVFVDAGCLFHLYVLSKRVLWPHPLPDNTETLLIVFNYVANVLTLLIVGSFSAYQFYSLCTNTTTIESWERDKVSNLVRRGKIREIKYPYQLSVYDNICSILGPRPLLWLLPQRMRGNGLTYPTASNTGKWVDVHVRGRSILREPKQRTQRHRATHAALHLEDGSPVDTNVTPDEQRRGRAFEDQVKDMESRLMELAARTARLSSLIFAPLLAREHLAAPAVPANTPNRRRKLATARQRVLVQLRRWRGWWRCPSKQANTVSVALDVSVGSQSRSHAYKIEA
ncbi:hypothetical protein E3P99_03257 [Wallemia hederae]|uniref:Palmitoyltransferase n=1 Tax=Wallemia hederae TaxID=1540922 RepID=A0A4T0FH85_9BASI|nr:hypothetical protein E3P99_03257 [Wallemia hederae]